MKRIILDFTRSFSAASETGLFAAPPTTGKRTGARLLGTNTLCLRYSPTHLILTADYLSCMQLGQSKLQGRPDSSLCSLESNARAQCYQNPGDATFMVHISTAHPAGSLVQQVHRNSSSTGILAVATDAGFFLSVTLLKMFSSMSSLASVILYCCKGQKEHPPKDSQVAYCWGYQGPL